MLDVSELFKTYADDVDRKFDIVVSINSVEYTRSSIIDFSIDDSIILNEGFGIGSITTAVLKLTLKTSNIIPSNALVIPKIKLTGEYGASELVELGHYYIDTRLIKETTDGVSVITFSCLDRLVMTEQPFESTLEYPNTMVNALEEIRLLLDLELDDTVVINPAYMIPYRPDDFTIREVLSNIASAHGESFKIKKDGKLGFINSQPFSLSPSRYVKCVQNNTAKTFTKFVCIYNSDGETLERGIGTADATLVFTNYFINDDIMDAVYVKLNGFTYTPFTMTWKGNVYVEVGDVGTITLKDGSVLNNAMILMNNMAYKGGLIQQSSAPGKSEQRSEFDFKGSLKGAQSQAFTKVVNLNKPYYGVTIGRANGLTIKRSDGEAEAIFNADTFSMKSKNEGGTLEDAIYFDTILRKYKIKGNVTIEGSLASDADFTDSLYAENGDISELSVSMAKTVSNAWYYIAQDTSDIYYISMKGQNLRFVVGQVHMVEDIPQTEQLKNPYGDLLYWYGNPEGEPVIIRDDDNRIIRAYPTAADGTRLYVTKETTDWPVMSYVYIEQVKRAIEFMTESPFEPLDTFGVGDGNGREIGYIKKNTGSLDIYYDNANGKTGCLSVSDFVDATHRRMKDLIISRVEGKIMYRVEGLDTSFELDFVESEHSITITWDKGLSTEYSATASMDITIEE